MSAHGAHPKGSGMRLRSLLFVPGDQPERFEKAAASGTDAVILDLEDSVSPANKAKARTAVAAWLKESEGRLARFVRLNPLNSGLVDADLDAVIGAGADALVLRSEEHTSELQSLMRISYAVFCLKKKKMINIIKIRHKLYEHKQ